MSDREPKSICAKWRERIKRALDDEDEWCKAAKQAVKVYEGDSSVKSAFNILNSNVETLAPALYNSTPVPDVRRRFDDGDQVAKHIVDLCERAIIFALDQHDPDSHVRAAIKDALVPGRGVLRIRYEPDMDGDYIRARRCEIERVPWDRFVRGPALAWDDMQWCAVLHDLSHEEVEKLNPKLAKEVGTSEHKENGGPETPKMVGGTVKVFEIWDRQSGVVLFIADNSSIDEPLKETPDPLKLPGFFPFKRPVQALSRVVSLTPVCPYELWKPLIDELDTVTKRISKLTRQLKVRGLIAGEVEDDFKAVQSLEDGQYQKAGSSASFVNGIDKLVAHWPMEPTVLALKQLYEQRESVKQTIYEVTGISDVVRGASVASETATAQQIKSQWGSLRIQQMQAEIQRVIRDLFRDMVAIFQKHYDDATLSRMTGLPATAEQKAIWPAVMQAFRSDALSYRIDVESDSTIRADMTRNQEQMNLFLQATAQFGQAMVPVVQMGPQFLPVVVEVYAAFARKFKLGKQAEDAIDRLTVEVPQMAQQALAAEQQPQDDPKLKQIEAQMRRDDQKHALEMDGIQIKNAAATEDHQRKMQAAAVKSQAQQQRANGNLSLG